MGYSHLTSFFAYFFGFGISGWLLKSFAPDPATLPPDVYAQWQAATTTGATAGLPARCRPLHLVHLRGDRVQRPARLAGLQVRDGEARSATRLAAT